MNEPVAIAEGLGLHSGKPVRAVIRRGRPGSGIVFVQGETGIAMAASPRNAVSADRRTALAARGARIDTIEHLLGAAFLRGATDFEAVVWGGELPALDGAGAAWDALLRRALGPMAAGHAPVLRIPEQFGFAVGGSWARSFTAETGGFRVRVSVPIAGIPHEAGIDIHKRGARRQLLAARTFCLASEAPALLHAGYGRGLTQETCLVLPDGPEVSADSLREAVHHKIFDLLGDLRLTGAARFAGGLYVHRPGHGFNVRLAAALQPWVRMDDGLRG